ncbi:ribonuclease HII [Candidatus Woesearchaeota archaeon]|nr:ribonuclease HII [Candidatus Woesearchaeota archaeon]
MLECGIDEAGRGPIIGPMVIAGVLIDDADLPELEKIGVKDSKLIFNHHMKKYADKIITVVKKYKIIIVPPEEIDAALRHPSLNLNWLEALKAVEIIDALKPERAIIDSPSPNIPAFQNYLEKKLSHHPKELICAHKADAKYLTVGAASILAKNTREEEVAKIKNFIGIDFGSGYPSDPKTKRFAKDYHEQFPEFFRKSWQPYKDIINGKKQKKLGEY